MHQRRHAPAKKKKPCLLLMPAITWPLALERESSGGDGGIGGPRLICMLETPRQAAH